MFMKLLVLELSYAYQVQKEACTVARFTASARTGVLAHNPTALHLILRFQSVSNCALLEILQRTVNTSLKSGTTRPVSGTGVIAESLYRMDDQQDSKPDEEDVDGVWVSRADLAQVVSLKAEHDRLRSEYDHQSEELEKTIRSLKKLQVSQHEDQESERALAK